MASFTFEYSRFIFQKAQSDNRPRRRTTAAVSVYHHPIMSDSDQPSIGSNRATAPALYSVRGIVIGTILGSLAAGVVMIYLNYRALGRASLARTVSTVGAAVFFVVMGLATLMPNTLFMALVMMVVQVAIAYFLTVRLQGEAIAYHQERGGLMHGSGRAAAVGFLTGMALFFLLILGANLYLAVTGQLPEPPAP